MYYLEKLIKSSEKYKSIVSMGLDPIIENIPLKKGSKKERIIFFYETILNKMVQKDVYPASVKPNYAFYAQYGIEGIEALLSVIEIYKSHGFPIILDVKRGDIAKTAYAYARECFEFFNADSVTISPYMGYDSVSPFIENYPDKGYYILNKTSNKSSMDFQDVSIDGKPLYIHVSEKIVEWYKPGIAAVVGATYPEQLKSIVDIFISSKKDIPLLIPGIGSQGGDLKEIIKILSDRYSDKKIHRINSSGEINYAYKKFTEMTFDEAAVEVLKQLNERIEEYSSN